MTGDLILRLIADCEWCGDFWPRLRDEHRDAVEDWIEEQQERAWRQEQAGSDEVTVGP